MTARERYGVNAPLIGPCDGDCGTVPGRGRITPCYPTSGGWLCHECLQDHQRATATRLQSADAEAVLPDGGTDVVMSEPLEEMRQELKLARDAVTKNDEYAAIYHLKQAHAYGIDIPGFVDHPAAATVDTPAEVGRLRDALDGALVCPPEDRGDYITQALDAVNEVINADAGGGDDQLVVDQYGLH